MTNLVTGAAALPAGPQSVTISNASARPTTIGSPDYFTGAVTVEPMFEAHASRNVSAAMVTFPPGARTAWHTHPTGQTLVVVSGTGWTEVEGSDRRVITAGDIVWFPPGVRHWHGATDTNAMRHIAVTGVHPAQGAVTWLEHVPDAHYAGD